MHYMHEMAIVLKNKLYELTYNEIEILSSSVTLEVTSREPEPAEERQAPWCHMKPHAVLMWMKTRLRVTDALLSPPPCPQQGALQLHTVFIPTSLLRRCLQEFKKCRLGMAMVEK